MMFMQLAFSQESKSNLDGSCPSPENFAGENYYDEGEFGAHLSWDRAEYEFTLDRFEVYRSADGVDYEMVKRVVNTPSITHYECIDVVSEAGLYYYRIIAFYQNECESDPLDIEVEVIDYTAVDENPAGDVSIYPNPTSGKIVVKAEMMNGIEVFNALGQTILVKYVENDEVSLDLSSFGNGIYFINILTENGIVVKKINVK